MPANDTQSRKALTQSEVDDIRLLIEKHIESGEDGLAEFCNLIDDQGEDMLFNLTSALEKLGGPLP